jgi:hypothetical protein
MAELEPDTRQLIWDLKQSLLEVIDVSRSIEFTLLNTQGETNETIEVLDELQKLVDKAIDRFSRLSTLQIRIAEAQPFLSQNMLAFVTQAIATSEAGIPALKRSLEEIRQGLNL